MDEHLRLRKMRDNVPREGKASVHHLPPTTSPLSAKTKLALTQDFSPGLNLHLWTLT